MIQYFFLCLVRLWLEKPALESACRQAIDFYYWSQRLKTFAFLPGTRETEVAWRVKQLQKWMKRMPKLDIIFSRELGNVEKLYDGKSITHEDLQMITIKRENLDSLLKFFHELKSNEDVEKLRAMLTLEKDPRSFLKLKKNNHQ